MPLFSETRLGFDGDLVVKGTNGAPMLVEMHTTVAGGLPVDMFEALSREDVERLRDLCDEALT